MIGEARKRAADSVGRQFIKVRGDDAPCALDSELHEEGAERQQQRTEEYTQSGITGMASSDANTIARRRPIRSDKSPKVMPPRIAPTL